MSKNGPVDMEGMASDVPTIEEGGGREVNPDRNEPVPTNKDKTPVSEHMASILEHVPEELRERVSKIQREELVMPGLPRDREAYEAYLGAEKMIRDIHRRKVKADHNFKGLPKEEG